MKIKNSRIEIWGLIFAFTPLLFSISSRASESYNLQLKDANCKCGAVVSCYGSSCEPGTSICYSNPCNCPKCSEQ